MARLSKMAATMTAAQFDQAAARFGRLSAKARAVARAVLVEGRPYEQIATEHGCSRQLAHQWATKVYEAFCPDGWESATVTLPAQLMQRVRQMQAEARAQWEREQPAARIVRHPPGTPEGKP